MVPPSLRVQTRSLSVGNPASPKRLSPWPFRSLLVQCLQSFEVGVVFQWRRNAKLRQEVEHLTRRKIQFPSCTPQRDLSLPESPEHGECQPVRQQLSRNLGPVFFLCLCEPLQAAHFPFIHAQTHDRHFISLPSDAGAHLQGFRRRTSRSAKSVRVWLGLLVEIGSGALVHRSRNGSPLRMARAGPCRP